MKKVTIGEVLAANLASLMARCPSLSTQVKVAQKSGLGQTTVSRILRNEASATIENVGAIADAFGVSVGALLSAPDPEMLRPLDARQQRLFELFDGLPESEQDQLIRMMEAKKVYYDARVKELMAQREQAHKQPTPKRPQQPSEEPSIDITIIGHVDDPFAEVEWDPAGKKKAG